MTVSDTVSVYINTDCVIQYQSEFAYFESGNYSMHISYPNLQTGVVGIIWNFMILETQAYILDYVSGYSTECIVDGCLPCDSSMIFNSAIGCLSTEMSYNKNSASKPCPCSLGCLNAVCLTGALCVQNTYQVLNNTVMCMCANNAAPTVYNCECPSHQYYYGQTCYNCIEDCDTCSNPYNCDTCIASNAFANGNGCTCKSGYYNSTRLVYGDACQPCNPKCTGCNSQGKCLGCTDPNADYNNNCNCRAGFYFENYCKPCYSECASCSNSSLCTTCVAQFAKPGYYGCSCITGYGGAGVLDSVGSCMKCNKDCLSCVNGNRCTECIDPNGAPSAVGCECKKGYYLNNTVCVSCPINCKSCNSTQCFSCWAESAIVRSNVCYCGTGYYESKNASGYLTCVECNRDCLTCNETGCIQCIVTGAVPSIIGCVCRDGYYENLNICTKCNYWTDTGKCINCKSSQYYYNQNCYNCPRLCLTCDPSNCKSCVPNAEIVGSTCECSTMYQGNTDCTPVPFMLTIIVTNAYSILLQFSHELMVELKTSDVNLGIVGAVYSFDIAALTAGSYLCSVKYKSLFNNSTSGTLILLRPVVSVLNATLSLEKYSFELYNNNTNAKTLAEYETQGATAIYATTSISMALSLLNLNFISLWSFLNTIQLLIYMRLTNITIPIKLNSILKGFRKFNSLPNLMNYVISSSNLDPTSSKIQDFGYSTDNIFINVGSLITALGIVIGNMIIFIALKYITRVPVFNRFKIFVENSLKNFRYCAYIRYYIQFYLDYAVCSIIGLINLYAYTWVQLLNCIFCMATLIFVCATPLIALWFINSYKDKIRNNDERLKEKYGSLYYEFCNDHGLLSSLFYLFFFSRRLCFILTVFALERHPIFQAIINYVVTVAVTFI